MSQEKIECPNCHFVGTFDFKEPITFVECSKCGQKGLRAATPEIAEEAKRIIEQRGWPMPKKEVVA